MRLIPVIDLLDSRVVHAVRGERKHYKPVKSVLCQIPDPLAVASAFRNQLGLKEIYIADLNAIQGIPLSSHRELIVSLAHRERMEIILDAGIADVEDARDWLALGVHKAVVGAETLGNLDELWRIPANLDPGRLVFSLDMRGGKVLSRIPDLAAMPVSDLLEQLRSAGWQEIILLDLSLVGSGEGTSFQLASEAQARFPELSLLVGGGIAGIEELLKLKAAGIAGVLLATALHSGAITSKQIADIQGRRGVSPRD
jgi:phosphoribosylformimino-5-aminoimidazole carboxamide ribotide isomerase